MEFKHPSTLSSLKRNSGQTPKPFETTTATVTREDLPDRSSSGQHGLQSGRTHDVEKANDQDEDRMKKLTGHAVAPGQPGECIIFQSPDAWSRMFRQRK